MTDEHTDGVVVVGGNGRLKGVIAFCGTEALSPRISLYLGLPPKYFIAYNHNFQLVTAPPSQYILSRPPLSPHLRQCHHHS